MRARCAFVALALVPIGVIVITMLGRASWNRATANQVARITAAHTATPRLVRATRYTREEIVALPAPVVRYFDFALTPGQPLIERARIEWDGEFSMKPGQWSGFTATQHFNVHPPGFVWDANIAMMPLVGVRVRDSYVEGEGALLAIIGGLVRVADLRGTPALASGELMRHLAESVWFPTALLPSAGVAWRAIDDSTASAAINDGATTVTVEVHFGARGDIVSFTAIRPRDVNGSPELTPWVARVRDYARHDGMMIPESGDVEWMLPSGPLPYWRGHPRRVPYDFAPDSQALNY